jgi:hypothetical protein
VSINDQDTMPMEFYSTTGTESAIEDDTEEGDGE